jgi:hypothetical protein
MDPDDHVPTGTVVPEGRVKRKLTGVMTWCTVLQQTFVSSKLASVNDAFDVIT